jgi:hypothetical protein
MVYASGVPRKTPARAQAQPHRHPAIILEIEPHKYAVAVWRRDEGGEPVYEILHRDIREVKVAATLARAAEADTRIVPDPKRS